MNLDAALRSHQRRIEARLARIVTSVDDASLRAPIAHVVHAGGKRLRPLITLLSCEAAGGRAADALDAAAAVELLHTFTLVHDDIMDNAALRRGRATVHTKWDANMAILAGDTIAALAMRALAASPHPRAATLAKIFAKGFVDVCVGQAEDKRLEHAPRVTMREYLAMIGMKTAAMFSSAAGLGACIATRDAKRHRALQRFGNELGMAFQIRDDALDVDADRKKLGKDFCGDIREGKKAFLYVAARSIARTKQNVRLLDTYVARKGLRGADLARLRELYLSGGAFQIATHAIDERTRRAITALRSLPKTPARDQLESLARALTDRRF